MSSHGCPTPVPIVSWFVVKVGSYFFADRRDVSTNTSGEKISTRPLTKVVPEESTFKNHLLKFLSEKVLTSHIMGLGHPTTAVSSIMRAIITDCASNPTAHDTTDLAAFYPNPPCPASYQEPTANLQQGTTYAGVYWTQWFLNYRGYGLAVDGVFGSITDTQVRSFQQANNLQVDGIVGPLTRSKLKITSFGF